MTCYLDNAATTFPKPLPVYDEVYRCISRYCGNPGRGGHPLSLASSQKIYECRELLGELFGVSDPERICFAQNTTYALNSVIKGLLANGDHVIISDIEHNAVFRPIYRLALEGMIEYDVFSSMLDNPRRSPTLICAKIASLLRPNTKMVICTHMSNICSASMPIKEIADFCHKRGIYFVVDGAQSAGHLDIKVDQMKLSALCIPAHKGLYGIQGAGAFILGKDVLPNTLAEGGSGVNSLEGQMPDILPERYEAGTLPTPSIAGLCEGIRFINRIGITQIIQNEKELFNYAKEGLCNIDKVSIYAPAFEGPTLLFNVDGVPSDTVANELAKNEICARGGYHCTPLAHKTLKTPQSGAARISFGIFNKKKDIDRLCLALNDFVKTL